MNTYKDNIVKLALSMYEGEPCRVCGELITDATKAIYAGYSKGSKSRSAHESCWNSNKPKNEWAYPEDDKP